MASPDPHYNVDIGSAHGTVIGDHAQVNQTFVVSPQPQVDLEREGKRLLKRGQNALLRNDYASAKRDIEKAVEILREDEFPEESAKARYLLTLTLLNGKRPFVQTQSAMRSAESLMRSAIALHRSYTYILTLALFKRDFARNGLPHLVQEARELEKEANQVAQIPEDAEDMKLLAACQPALVHDFLSS